jgi:uncharacterized protein YdeI (YjbR/CyaY-like superfamily)
MRPRFFRSPTDLRAWLERNHDRAGELWVGLYKKASGRKGITYREAVDEALAFGWIDGLTKGIDDQAWMIRFTPRRPKSNWSAVNVKRFGELEAEGRVTPAGRKAFRDRVTRAARYSYEAGPRELDPAYEKRLRANRRAWAFFQSQAPSYQRAVRFWVMTAKKEETRLRRLGVLIDSSERGSKVPPLRPPSEA